MSGTDLKRDVLRKHRGKSVKQAFLDEWQTEDDPDRRVALAKSAPQATVETTEFTVRAEGSVGTLWKSDDDFAIWGPASVEVVDKENDRIQASALEDALPQLLKRASLSYEHSDQIVGEIQEKIDLDEPTEVSIGDSTVERSEFPTDVLELADLPPALYVAGNVYNDTQKSREVREAIEKGDIGSYSISGEAITSSFNVQDGEPITDISKLDLSAVTLCSEGMNQMAKFGVVTKSADGTDDADPLGPDDAATLLKEQTMGSNNDDDPLTKSGMEAILDEHLPDGELATKADVEAQVDKQLDEFEKEVGSPSDGSAERPSGDGDGGTETDPEDDGGDAPAETATDSDKVEEKSQGMTMDELKSALPDDQFKAIEPTLKEAMGPDGTGDGDGLAGDDEEAEVDVLDEPPVEEDPVDEAPDLDEGPDLDDEDPLEDPAEKAKALGLDPQSLSDEQLQAVAKADTTALDAVGGIGAPAEDGENALDKSADGDDLVKNAATSPSGSKFFGADGEVKL